MRAEIWDNLVLPGVTPAPQADTVYVISLAAIYDPAYTTPWLLAPPLKLKATNGEGHVPGSLASRADTPFRPADGRRSSPVLHADESIQRRPE